jgi:GDP-mannose 6-dehydrogenase
VCVIGSRDPQVLAALDLVEERHQIVDLVRAPDAAQRRGDPRYTGIAW